MLRVLAVVIIGVLAAGCTRAQVETDVATSNLEPFPGVDLSKLSPTERQVVTEASEDFRSVLSGQKPVHAVFDKDAPLPSDGGTTFYRGKHYRLTVNMTLLGIGNNSLTAFGPRLEFDDQFIPGFNQDISSIRLYNQEQMRSMVSGHGL